MFIFSSLAPAFSAGSKHDSFEDPTINDEKIQLMKEVIGEHERLLEKEPTLDSFLMNQQNSNEEVEVIIQFSEAPVALEQGKQMVQNKTLSASEEGSIKSKIQAQHTSFKQFTKTENISYTEIASFETVLNGMAIKVHSSDLDALLAAPGIVSIEPNSEVYALETPKSDDESIDMQMDQTVPHLGVPELWERGITGEGVKVAVLDTGIDYDHPDFEGVYKGGINFVKHDSTYTTTREEDDPYETYPSERAEGVPEFDAQGSSFYTSHGTHVAGTIVAQGNNEYGITGIAPDIELYAYRVLGAYGSGSISGIIEAIDRSVVEGMDIINLSLGGGSNSEHSSDTIAINNAALAGVTPVIATGNSGPGRGTVGNPAGATLAISVGNSTAPEELIDASVHVEAGDYSLETDMSLMGWAYGSDPSDVLSGEFEVVAIPGYGEPSDFEGIDVEGKVALISRGDIAFVDKIYAAREAGAIGTLIHNNVDSGPADVFLSTAFDFIPSFDMATEDGEALREALESNTGTVSFGDFKSSLTDGDEMSPSSSQGPTTPNFDIKPDVVAPGSNIMSTVPAYLKDFPDASFEQAYDRASGTSMATPHVAAVAALLQGENPDWGPADIKVAMSNTAKLLDTDTYDVFAQGAGLVQPVAAIDADAYAYVLDTALSDDVEIKNTKGTVTFGNIEPTEEEQTFTKEIDLRNVSGDVSDYDISVEVTQGATGDMEGASVSVDKDSVSLSDSETVTATLHVPAGEGSSGNEILGYIHMSNGSTDISLPFAAAFAGESGGGGDSDIGYAYLDDYAIAIDSDGNPSQTNFNFQLLDLQYITYVELWDASDPYGGPYGDGSIGEVAGGLFLDAGNYYMEFDGEYLSYETEEPAIAEDGVYTFDLVTMNLYDDVFGEWDGPFYIKSTNPEIEMDEVETTDESVIQAVTGTIDDQFVDFKEIVETAFDGTYNVNEHITTTYEFTDGDEVVEEGETYLDDDGSFAVSTADLNIGTYTFTLTVIDRLGHTAEANIEFEVTIEPEVIDVTLTPSTTEPTEGPVTIDVTTNSESDLTDMKWLAGERDVADFSEDGEPIDLEESSFDVDENGAYTVYVQNENSVEAVGTIDVQNIETEEESFTIELDSSPTEQTEEAVTISIETDSPSDLTDVKWLKGEHDVDAFAEGGEQVDLDAMAFDVEENATYTVYAVNSDGVEAVESITITNIINPDASAFELTFDLAPTEPTEGPVSITVDTTSEAELSSLEWLPGVHHSPDAFEEDGNAIDSETSAFDVEENGVYTVLAVNSEDEVAIGYVEVTNIIEEQEPVPFTVSLEPSTTEPTEDPVTIFVTTDSEAAITTAKWLPGEHVVADFADDGHNIDLETMAFDVTENGTYSVYVQNEEGVEVVQTISVTNITTEEPDPTPAPMFVTFNLSKTDPTDEPITIGVEVETEADVTTAKWLEGRKSLEDVRNNGTDILDDMSFVVTKNGTYSVYVENSDGVEVLTTITITNIIPESPEDPEKPGEPGDPADPSPCIPCDDDNGDDDDGDGGNDGDNGNNGTGGNNNNDGSTLPSTATNTFNVIAIGITLLIAGGLTLYVVYRRKKNLPVE